MRAIFLAGIAAAMLTATCANATGPANGMGVSLCGDLYKAYSGASSAGQQALIIAVGEWAFGYMTGRNSEQPQSAWKDVQSIDIDETAAFIISQCGSHPSLYVGQVVDVIYDALPNVGGTS